MGENISNFKNFIYLKDQLLKADCSILKEVYQDYDKYVAFVVAVVDLINNEPLFFLLNEDMIDEVEEIISIHRFTKNDYKLKETINQIIIFLNGFNAYNEEEKNLLYYDFVINQEDMRRVIFKDENALVKSLLYDAEVLDALEDNDLDSLEEDSFTLMSINYLISKCSNLFVDENVFNNTVDKLNNISERSGILKRDVGLFSKSLKEAIQKVKNKEE